MRKNLCNEDELGGGNGERRGVGENEKGKEDGVGEV